VEQRDTYLYPFKLDPWSLYRWDLPEFSGWSHFLASNRSAWYTAGCTRM